MTERDILRAAAFGSFKSRQIVFGDQMESYYQLLLHVLSDLDNQLYRGGFDNPDLSVAENKNRRMRASRLRGKLCSLRDQIQNVKVGLKTKDDYASIEAIVNDTPTLVNTLLAKLVPLPGALRFQPRNAEYLIDDIELLIEHLTKRDEHLAESFGDIADWMQEDLLAWRKTTGRENTDYVPEDMMPRD